MNSPGKDRQTFEIMLQDNCFTTDDILYFSGCDPITSDSCSVTVVSVPKEMSKWYHKVIRFLTFGWLCKPKWTYTVKLVN